MAHARDLQRSAHNAARFPSAYLGLKQTTGTPLRRRSDDPDEVTVETVLRDWRNARLNPDGGGVAWLGGVDVVELGTFAEHLVTAGRNAADVDIARHSYIPADLIDASVPESSLHYSTSRDNDRRRGRLRARRLHVGVLRPACPRTTSPRAGSGSPSTSSGGWAGRCRSPAR